METEQKVEVLEPKTKTKNPEVTVLVPALNEQLTISEFIDWCFEGFREAAVVGEVIIVDSSSDDTPEIAVSKGARVVRVPKRGLGRAYIDAIPYVGSEIVIMGDCDLTYDFRQLAPFIEQIRSGKDYVMGSRFKGSIEPGSMPPLHQYFGTPLTTWILNAMYHTKYSDIHCGMRAITLDALKRMDLSSQSWEYASEMVLKAARQNLHIAEVPVHFYKDRDGRVSHHKRMGFLSPWIAGLVNLNVMLTYSADRVLKKLSTFSLLIGLLLVTLTAFEIEIFGAEPGANTLLIGLIFGPIGYLLRYLADLSSSLNKFSGETNSPLLRTRTSQAAIFSLASLAAAFALFLLYALNQIGVLSTLSGIATVPMAVFLTLMAVIVFASSLVNELMRRIRSR